MASICTYHEKRHNKGMDEKDYMSLVSGGTHVSNLKPKLGLRELTMGRNSKEEV